MYKIKLSPYHKIFYNEWQINPSNRGYNIVFDQILSNNLKIPLLQKALYRFISDYVLLNSHVKEIDNVLYWVKNHIIKQLEYFGTKYNYEDIKNYTLHPFDLLNGPLYRFAVFKIENNKYRFIIVLHHVLIQ